MSLIRSYAERVASAQNMGLRRQNADLFVTKDEIPEIKEAKRIAAKKKALTRKPTGRYFLNRKTTGRGSKKRRRKSRKTKRRGKSRKVKTSTMRKHSKKHSKRHINHMKKMMKKGYSFKKAHRSAMRKVGK